MDSERKTTCSVCQFLGQLQPWLTSNDQCETAVPRRGRREARPAPLSCQELPLWVSLLTHALGWLCEDFRTQTWRRTASSRKRCLAKACNEIGNTWTHALLLFLGIAWHFLEISFFLQILQHDFSSRFGEKGWITNIKHTYFHVVKRIFHTPPPSSTFQILKTTYQGSSKLKTTLFITSLGWMSLRTSSNILILQRKIGNIFRVGSHSLPHPSYSHLGRALGIIRELWKKKINNAPNLGLKEWKKHCLSFLFFSLSKKETTLSSRNVGYTDARF